MDMVGEQEARKGRHHGEGQQVRRHHRQNHGDGQRNEQEARRAIRQDESARAAALRHAADVDQARLDPAARLFAAVTGAHAETVLLVSQLVAVICLELVGCVLWLRVASLRTATAEATLPATLPAAQAVTARSEPSNEASHGASPADDDQVAAAVRRGDLKPTVAAIRQFVGCSQARAMTIRRRLLATGIAPDAPGGAV